MRHGGWRNRNPSDEDRLARRGSPPASGLVESRILESWALGGAELAAFAARFRGTADHVAVGPVTLQFLNSTLTPADCLVNWSELAMHCHAQGREIVLMAASANVTSWVYGPDAEDGRRRVSTPYVMALFRNNDGTCGRVDGSGTEVLTPAAERAVRFWFER